MLNANDTTTLGKEYNTYASSVMNAKEFYNHGVIAHQTKMIGDASWLQMVSYRDWVLSNYKNMLQFREEYEQVKVSSIVQQQYAQKAEANQRAYNEMMAQLKPNSNTRSATNSVASTQSVSSVTGSLGDKLYA